MNDRLTRLLGIEHPIIQAPMVGVSTPRLAAAVSNAGALGSIGVGASTVEQARAMIQQTRELTDRPFNVNLFCHRPARADVDVETRWLEHLAPLFGELGGTPPNALREIYRSFVEDDAMLRMLCDERPAVVSFHFGLPPQGFIEALKEAGVLLLCSVTHPEEARLAEAAGVDALVAQGYEAGGHRGVFEPERDAALGTFALLGLLANPCRIPLIAAGGIMDGRGIAAAMRLGASGAQLGTAFILCPESSANAAYRGAMKSARTADTRITSAISGRPARGLVNRLLTALDAPGRPRLPDYPIAYDAAKALLAAAGAAGNDDFAVQWAGQGAPLARELPAVELVRLLVQELTEAG
jgi:nitronate monooxygenase